LKGATFMSTATIQTQTAPIDGLKIRYADSGTAYGPVILLTSPWPESLFAFRRIWPLLTQTGRLVAVDLPGFGHSAGRPDVLTPTAMGEFLGHVISKLGLGKPHLVAPDVGASAALFLAAHHPDAVTCSSTTPSSPPTWRPSSAHLAPNGRYLRVGHGSANHSL
jgi:pimeloyl-ACP methyl ester carboxylesterase